MKNYLEVFEPGGRIYLDNDTTKSNINLPDVRLWYENTKQIVKNVNNALMKYVDISKSLKEINPNYYKNHPDSNSNKIFSYIITSLNSDNNTKRNIL